MKSKVNAILFLLTFLASYTFCYAADVLLIDLPAKPSITRQQLELVCRFYGLDIERVSVGMGEDKNRFLNSLERSNARAIVIDAKSLPFIDSQEVLSTIKQWNVEGLSLLITGINPDIESRVLSRWSSGVIVGSTSNTKPPSTGLFKVTNIKDLAHALAGQDIPFARKTTNHFIIDKRTKSQTIMAIKNKGSDYLKPNFVRIPSETLELFFQTEIFAAESSQESTWLYDTNSFAEIAPMMMFIRYSFGKRCWHSPSHYANLTIDDPWLTEPYGHLSFKRLIEEMQKHNFHTTIAFIPWNYDRSKADVVSLFKEYPERLSISIHGNNHDHREFYKYEANIGDPWPAKPLPVQEANIKQALARMEEFKRRTGLSYDPVMVFPHAIAPAKTLGLLKKYNFLATANASNVPLGSSYPQDPLFHLRSFSLHFENFLSLNRYSAEGAEKGNITKAYSANARNRTDFAINLFLDNPILLYGHHDLFADSMHAFNDTADYINAIEPTVEWRSLGYIARHLYLQKMRLDGNYDIRPFSRSIVIDNPHQRPVTYFVAKPESFSTAVKQLTLSRQPYQYARSNNYMNIATTIPAGESRLINIEYHNDFDPSLVDISKKDSRVNRLRKISDFRDIVLSQNIFGRVIIDVYYGTGLFKLGLKRSAIIFFAFMIIIGFLCYYLQKYIRKKYKLIGRHSNKVRYLS